MITSRHIAPSFNEIISMHRAWARKNFPNAEKWEPLVGLQEEVGELSHAFLKNHQGIRLNEPHQENMADAVGDCVMYLLHFCTLNGIDFMQAVREVWATISQRDWNRHPDNGTGKVTLAGVLGEK